MMPATTTKQTVVTKLAIEDFVEQAYLDYSMSVVLDRALPFIGDGLKPVQRRIVYAMSELGLKAQAKPKKSARTIGDVIGKYHPHGDVACYEAMVLMAQPFAYRYPLIQGQGNWGSIDDPKSFAAMRYTEARLTGYAMTLLDELDQGTVKWRPNFDGTLREPEVLPACLPNLLLNGTSGIAVGMLTDVLPHNLREVGNACIALLAKPKLSLDELLEIVKGPDLPGGGEVVSSSAEIRELYETGSGALRIRASYTTEGGVIAVTALPHQVSVTRVMHQIGILVREKKLPHIKDLRDESDQDQPVRLIIVPQRRVDPAALMAHLFVHTDLERQYRLSFNVIGMNGKPQVKPLRLLLEEWLAFRRLTVTNRLNHRLERICLRLEEIEGFRTVYANLTEVIALLRDEDHPEPVLMKKFQLSENQVRAILDLRLRRLAKLEEIKLEQEYKALIDEQDKITQCLRSGRRLKTLIKNELKAVIDAHGDARRTLLTEKPQAQAMKESEMAAPEPITVVLSRMGWVKAAKGHDVAPQALTYRSGDEFLAAACGRSDQSVVVLDDTGRCYTLPASGLVSARGYGEPLSSYLAPPEGACFVGVFIGDDEQAVMLAGKHGYGLRVKLKDLITRSRAGKQVLNARAAGPAVGIVSVPSDVGQLAVAVTSQGRLLAVAIEEIPFLTNGKGNKLINIPKEKLASEEEFLVGVVCPATDQTVLIRAGKRIKKIAPAELAAYSGRRGRRGYKLPVTFRNVNHISLMRTPQSRLNFS